MATKEKTKRKPVQKTDTDTRSSSLVFNDLMELFVNGLKDMYWAENHLIKSLPKMRSASSSKELQTAIEDHLEVTKGHVSRLEQIFEMIGQRPLARKCDAMEGLTLEGEGVIEDTMDGSPSRELGISLACQKVEHYEMAAYMGLAKLATSLGYPEVAELLSETLKEEEDSAELLSEMSNELTDQGLSEV